MTRIVCAVLVFVLAASPLFAQRNLQDSIRREASALASAQATEPPADQRFPPAFLWTGIGLMAAGGLYVVVAAIVEELCDNSSTSTLRCESNHGFVRGVGIGLAGAGGVVLAIGASKRGKTSPQIVTMPGRGIAIQQKVVF